MFDEEAMGFTKKIMYKLLHDLVECTVGWRDNTVHQNKYVQLYGGDSSCKCTGKQYF